ncbi:MAG TPA: 2-oxoglutarate dehydrogenase complex dihydrolipoyllysine-residue succinyltransferase [Steroidobacteraceae bacterium]|jgi:2-oxoglutarate dehydrogenase E2 component (dihydrolipoamide succinyltransferase)|nr:2-oxoglutarate dehydrogenase complex dihydrolipoyllysine-residue succinyltransferase [Steroidobacteraceae bacterium]
MSIEIRVPALPESIADATLVAWHKQPGEAFKRDENLADLETDKVVLEVPAPADGVMGDHKFEVGATVTEGQVLAQITAGAAPTAAAAAPAKAAPATPAAAKAAAPADAAKLSPSVRRMVEENKLDPAAVPGTGRDGRLTKSDVAGFLEKKPAAAAPAAAAPAAAKPAAVPAGPRVGRAEQRVAMSRLRQRVAQRLVEAQSTQALLTSFNEVDLGAVQELRARYKDKFEKTQGVKLGFMSFFVKATIEALKKFPVLNASVDGSDIIYHEFYDIGVAVSTDRGLMVPIVRDADLKSFADIEKEITAYATRARAGQIAIEDITGGTFTITNGGVFGSLLSTPIVNAPQSAILGMHKIQDRPMVVNGKIEIRPMMYLAVTYDHRIIDGRDAVQFLVAVKDGLEDPGRMLLGL